MDSGDMWVASRGVSEEQEPTSLYFDLCLFWLSWSLDTHCVTAVIGLFSPNTPQMSMFCARSQGPQQWWKTCGLFLCAPPRDTEVANAYSEATAGGDLTQKMHSVYLITKPVWPWRIFDLIVLWNKFIGLQSKKNVLADFFKMPNVMQKVLSIVYDHFFKIESSTWNFCSKDKE